MSCATPNDTGIIFLTLKFVKCW